MKEKVIDLFNNGGIKDGNKIAHIEEKDGASFMKEFDSGNNLIRESKFIDSKLSQIDEITQNGTNIYCVNDKGKLSKYTEGFEILPDGTEKYAKHMDVEYQFMTYTEGFERSTGGREKCAKIGHLEDGELYEYIEGYNKNLIDRTESYAKRIEKNEKGKWVEVEEN